MHSFSMHHDDALILLSPQIASFTVNSTLVVFWDKKILKFARGERKKTPKYFFIPKQNDVDSVLEVWVRHHLMSESPHFFFFRSTGHKNSVGIISDVAQKVDKNDELSN